MQDRPLIHTRVLNISATYLWPDPHEPRPSSPRVSSFPIPSLPFSFCRRRRRGQILANRAPSHLVAIPAKNRVVAQPAVGRFTFRTARNLHAREKPAERDGLWNGTSANPCTFAPLAGPLSYPDRLDISGPLLVTDFFSPLHRATIFIVVIIVRKEKTGVLSSFYFHFYIIKRRSTVGFAMGNMKFARTRMVIIAISYSQKHRLSPAVSSPREDPPRVSIPSPCA